MRSFLGFFALAFILPAFPAGVSADTPVDIYHDMQSGAGGEVLTAAVMNASNHGAGDWSVQGDTMWVGTDFARNLPGPVTVGGTTYKGTGGTRTWKLRDKFTNKYVSCKITGAHPTITTACYFTPGLTSYCYNYDDTIRLVGGGWGVMQMYDNDKKGPYLFAHACLGGNGVSRDSIKIKSGKTYWVNLHYDGVVGRCFVAAFDPDNGFAQVGTTIEAPAIIGSTISGAAQFGRCDNHGNDNNNGDTYSYFGQILVDYTHGAFPLLPSGGNDKTPPGAPAAVRDGTGADQSIALSATELSANWDPATDAESGIRGYQYAIGTAPGGTQVADWTPINNVLGVTRKGLTLTAGRTYYFSVKAVNGAGLAGPARNSKGQTVGTDTTPPTAPGAVRHGGMYGTMGKDIDETTTTTELACNFDPATDAESGIRGYEYAIGTAPGATDVKNWTPLASNAYLMYVRVERLSLTAGQRYYFAIRAINNAGLTGSAAISKGQTVVIKVKQPPKPAPAAKAGT